jgi:polar amino acid transport system substrate-binding protein
MSKHSKAQPLKERIQAALAELVVSGELAQLASHYKPGE